MKLLALADLHLSERKPDCRLDDEDWLKVIDDKITFIADTAKEHHIDYITISGDIFDSWRSNSFDFLSHCISWFNRLKTSCKELVCIPGNHDSSGGKESLLVNTPYGLFESLHVFERPSKDISEYLYTKEDKLSSDAKVVLAHKGLYFKEKPYPNAPITGNVEWFVRNCLPNTCQLLLAGDYHKPFVTKVDNCTVVNCGSLFRMRADQLDYQPKIWLCDITDTVTVKGIPVPLHNVIRRDYIDDVKLHNKSMQELIGSVDGNFEVVTNFKENFKSLIDALPNKIEILTIFERCNK